MVTILQIHQAAVKENEKRCLALQGLKDILQILEEDLSNKKA